MKKLMISFCFLLAAMGASAQFEQGKWILNPSLTGLNLSYGKTDKARLGLGAQGGGFIVDNVALLGTLEGVWTQDSDFYSIGGGARYYFDKVGFYVGGGLKLSRRDFDAGGGYTDYAATAETGYAFFLSRTVTIEPAVYCDLSLKDANYSRFGIKLGFGFYF